MSLRKISQLIGLASIAAVATVSSIGVNAAETTNVSLTVTAGVLSLYAGDGTANHDICTPANITAGDTVDTTVSGESATSVVCSTAENSLTLTGLSVASSRQNATSTIQDIVFEDLRGLASSDYTITASVSNFTDGSKAINLGSNPDGATSDTDADAPTAGDAGKLFAVLNASGGTVVPLRDATLISEGIGNYQKGSLQTVISTSTQVTLLSTTAAVRPGRVSLDNTAFKLRTAAYTQAGSYTGQITQTIV